MVPNAGARCKAKVAGEFAALASEKLLEAF